LGQAMLQGSGTVLSEQELLHHSIGLDHRLCNWGDNFRGFGQ
jgi:hypothetical protein